MRTVPGNPSFGRPVTTIRHGRASGPPGAIGAPGPTGPSVSYNRSGAADPVAAPDDVNKDWNYLNTTTNTMWWWVAGGVAWRQTV